MTRGVSKEGIMFDFIINRKNTAPRPGLYCVWIRAHEGENAPLISIWIDPTLAAFKSRVQETSTEIETTCAQDQIVTTN
jgi:hypothetical protein